MCEKATYPSYKIAATNLHIIKRRAKGKCPHRAYYCKVCRMFHLTSSRNRSKHEPKY